MESICPLCHHTRSLLHGNVYCSNSGSQMDGLDSATLYIKTNSMEETDEHVSRLSIRVVFNGEQYYKVGSQDRLINSNNFLIINQNQIYKTAVEESEEIEMLFVAFKPLFVETLVYSLTTPEVKLLDDPFKTAQQPILFFEKTFPRNQKIQSELIELKNLVANSNKLPVRLIDVNFLHTQLLTDLLVLHNGINSEIDKIRSIKKSTRIELYRRLSMARDYMDAHFIEKIELDDISKKAFLSVHHFKRSFKDLFGITPHQYINKKRIEKAQMLLTKTNYSVKEICNRSGFEDTSSFIRLFKRNMVTTPRIFRLLK
jgi:AraC family transcriptional regulator